MTDISKPAAVERPGRWARRAFSTLKIFAVVYAAALATMAFVQRDLLFVATHDQRPPAAIGLPNVQEIQVKTSDGETLVAWLVPPREDRPFLVYFHGNAGTIDWRANALRELTRDGAGLLAVEWRGYGASTGAPTQEGLQQDALAAYDYAIAAGARADRIVLVGESLGTGLAAWVARQRPVAGLVLDSPYSSIADVAAANYWMFPTRLVIRDPFPAAEWIKDVRAPVWATHYSQDPIIPYAAASALVAAAGAQDRFLTLPGRAHVALGHPEAMRQAKAFIAGLMR